MKSKIDTRFSFRFDEAGNGIKECKAMQSLPGHFFVPKSFACGRLSLHDVHCAKCQPDFSGPLDFCSVVFGSVVWMTTGISI